MAAHDGDGLPKDLPATWPFRAAGTILIFALAWFCLGYAIEDVGNELEAHMPVFWILLAIGGALVLVGAAYNIQLERRRKRHG
jgi:membrane protein DedA with SNARE-associated domain